MTRQLPKSIVVTVALLVLGAAVGCTDSNDNSSTSTTTQPKRRPTTTTSSLAPNGKTPTVFLVNIHAPSYDALWSDTSKMTFLNSELKPGGVLLKNYFGIAGSQVANLVAQISGQGPNVATASNCLTLSPFVSLGPVAPGQFAGNGCIFAKEVPSLASQFEQSEIPWRAYIENFPANLTGCPIVPINQPDVSQVPDYTGLPVTAVPWMYFAQVDTDPNCGDHLVGLDRLLDDLAEPEPSVSFHYLSPSLCSSGHIANCSDGQDPLVRTDKWLKSWIPKILDSDAFADDAVLIITGDFTDDRSAADQCCAGTKPPGIPAEQQPVVGGRSGALIIDSRHHSGVDATPYNHYATLCMIETLYGLERLGYAADPLTQCPTSGTGGAGSPL